MQTGEVYITRAVNLEMEQNDSLWLNTRPSWIHVETLIAPYDGEATAWQQARLLDAGEAEAIALARQVQADWFLTDDAAARLFAQALGLEVHGALGIILWATAVGHLNRTAAEAALHRLAQSSLWVSAKVLTEARLALDQLFS
jgi:predicted nucleic acid-binding protein